MAIKEYKLSDLCLVRNNLRTPINQNLRSKMKKIYPYYGANGIIDFVDFYKINFDCILVAEDGSVINSNGKLNVQLIKNRKMSVSNHAHVIENIERKIQLRYLYYLLIKINAKKFISGSVQQKLSLKNLLKINLFVPDIQTQQEIINIIEPFEKLRESITKKIKHLEQIKFYFFLKIKNSRKFKDFEFIQNGKGIVLNKKENGRFRYYNCSSNISFVSIKNNFTCDDTIAITTRGTIVSHIIPKNNYFYSTNNIIFFKGEGINCFDLFFNINNKKLIKGSAIPMITKSDLNIIEYPYDEIHEKILRKINYLIFLLHKTNNQINISINYLIDILLI